MPTLTDKEFGEITVRRSPRSRRMSISVAPNGTVRVTAPQMTPLFVIKRMLMSNRASVRELMDRHGEAHGYFEDMAIGKSHHLQVRDGQTTHVTRSGTQLIATIAAHDDIRSQATQTEIRKAVIAALRKEAKAYLPRRLAYLARQGDFSYQRVRLTHSSSRWGSCSSSGTISLNIALMKLPFELLDYVLVHELSHTVHMNHSQAFWAHVAMLDPQYRAHRRALKSWTPGA